MNYRAKTISDYAYRYLKLNLVDSEDRLKTRRELPNPHHRPREGGFEGPVSLHTLGPTLSVQDANYTEQIGPCDTALIQMVINFGEKNVKVKDTAEN